MRPGNICWSRTPSSTAAPSLTFPKDVDVLPEASIIVIGHIVSVCLGQRAVSLGGRMALSRHLSSSARGNLILWSRTAAHASSALLLSGCLGGSKLAGPQTVTSADQAAAVLVTPTMVAPWQQVAEQLAPKFTMSGDAAVARVMPTTERISEQALSALGISLAAGLPTTSTTGVEGRTGATAFDSFTAGGVTTESGSSGRTTTSTTTTTTAPGVAPAAPNGVPAGTTALARAAVAGELGIDPVLQYKAANYFNQNVQLLNTELRFAASASCYAPYVVKMKLAIMPYRPRLGYSLHTRIAFFNGDGLSKAAETSVKGAASELAGSGPESRTAAAVAKEPCASNIRTPLVIPLLAADDLKMALRQRSSEVAQQLGLALTFMAGGVGGSAGLNKLDQIMKAVQNQDISSSLTIARETENAIYVRVAPNNEASENPALVGQTYDIAVLLLVPTGYFSAARREPAIQVATWSQFRHATNGSVLPQRSPEALAGEKSRAFQAAMSPSAFRSWMSLPETSRQEASDSLVSSIQRGDYARFLAQLDLVPLDGCVDPAACAKGGNLRGQVQPSILWTTLGGLISDSPFKTALFQLPRSELVQFANSNQDVLIMDDGSDAATVAVRDVVDTGGRNLSARLEFEPADSVGKPLNTVVLPASTTSYDLASRTFTVKFPSLAKAGIKPSPGARLVLYAAPCDASHAVCATGTDGAPLPIGFTAHVISTKKEDSVVDFAVAAEQPFVMTTGHAGSVTLIVSKLPSDETVALSVKGAHVSSAVDAAGATLPFAKDAYGLAKDGRYIFSLSNLAAASSVSFVATGMRAGKPTGTTTVTIAVVK
jgi:hypothetical protein